MRAHELVNEIESLDKLSGEDWIPDLPFKKSKGLIPIPNMPGFYYKVEQSRARSGPTIYVFDSTAERNTGTARKRWESNREYSKRLKSYQDYPIGKVIASLSTSKKYPGSFPLDNAVQVGTLAVSKDYQGKGLAQFMYDVLLNELKYVLVAGSSQTPDGQRAWLNLAKNPYVNVSGYFVVSDQEINEKPSLIDNIMTLGGQKLGKTMKSRWGNYYAFAFPLKFGKERLNPVKLNKLSAVYGDDSFGTGMYAVGTRK